MYETKKTSVQNAWDIQSFRALGSSSSAQGFFDWLQIVFYSDLPVSYNFNLEAIQSTRIFFCLFLNPAHVPEKIIAQKHTQMVTDHTICCGGEAVCGCCHPKQNAVLSLPFPQLSGINHVLWDSLQDLLEFSTLPCLPPNPVFLPTEAQAQEDDHYLHVLGIQRPGLGHALRCCSRGITQ